MDWELLKQWHEAFNRITKTFRGKKSNISLTTTEYKGKLKIIYKILNSLSVILTFEKSPHCFPVTCQNSFSSYKRRVSVFKSFYFWESLCQYLIIGNGQPEGRELPLFIICNFHFGGCSFTVQCDILILSLLFSWNIFLFLSLFPSSFISSIDVFCRFRTSQNWTFRIFFEASTIHFVFTASN